MNDYFKEKLKEISGDTEQLSAYDAVDNTVVIAGPGSGKTTVLTLKVMQLLTEKIHFPRGLACLTYSTEAAREFKYRLNKFGLEKRKNIFLGTVHGFCLSEIITPFASIYPKYRIPQPIRIISEKDKHILFCEQNYEGEPKLTEVDKERTRNIKGISRVAIESYEVALKAAISFEELLLQKGYIDFISMVKLSVEIIKNEPYVRRVLEAKYPWIIVDEYQDLGKPLHEIILALLELTKIKIFAVGDADQSIYDFQGAAPDYLLELSERKDVKKIFLRNNYRSSQAIVDAAVYVLNNERNYTASGKLRSYKAKLEFHECSIGMDEQYDKAIEIIKSYYNAGIPYHEIAVLVGSNSLAMELAQKCGSQNIPTYFARQPFRSTDLIVWLQDCAKWVEEKNSVSFDELYTSWKSFVSYKHTVTSDESLELKRLLYYTLKESVKYKDKLYNWLDYVSSNIKLISIFQNSDRYPDEIENFKKLMNTAKESTDNYTISFLARLGVPDNKVVLSTRHSSKGLEFDVVIMLGMEKDSFPSYYNSQDPRKFKEDRRLCFVAVSRARKTCVFLRSKFLYNKKGKLLPKDPSPFWTELLEFQEKQIKLNRS